MNDHADLSDALSPVEKRVQSGDSAAFAEYFDSQRERFWQLIRFRMDARMASRVDVDDVIQETFLHAQKRLEHYSRNPAVSPFVWLRRMIHQTMIDLHRKHFGAEKRDVSREVSLHNMFPQATSESIIFQLLGSGSSPSQAFVKKESAAQIRNAIQEMDPIDREVLALRHYEELTNAEVAEVLDVSQATASVRYVRAIGRLKKILSAIEDFNDAPGEEPNGSK